MPDINPSLNVPQANFLQLPNKFRAFVAGFGSGKTWVGCASLCDKSWEFPKVPLGYFAPTYPQIRDIFFPTIDEVAFDWGLKPRFTSQIKKLIFITADSIAAQSFVDPWRSLKQS